VSEVRQRLLTYSLQTAVHLSVTKRDHLITVIMK